MYLSQSRPGFIWPHTQHNTTLSSASNNGAWWLLCVLCYMAEMHMLAGPLPYYSLCFYTSVWKSGRRAGKDWAGISLCATCPLELRLWERYSNIIIMIRPFPAAKLLAQVKCACRNNSSTSHNSRAAQPPCICDQIEDWISHTQQVESRISRDKTPIDIIDDDVLLDRNLLCGWVCNMSSWTAI